VAIVQYTFTHKLHRMTKNKQYIEQHKNLGSHVNFNLDMTVLITSLCEELHRCQRLSEASFPKYLSEQELFCTEVVLILDVLIHFFHKCWIVKDS
jgi:hypothetical protein